MLAKVKIAWHKVCSYRVQVSCGFVVCCISLLNGGCKQRGFNEHQAGFHEFAYVANTEGNTVTVLDLVYLRTDRTLRVGTAPVALAVNPTREEVYVVNMQPDQASGSVSVIETSRNEVVATIPVHRGPSAITVDPQGRRAFVVNTGSNTVSVLDLRGRRQLGSLPTGDKPGGVVISPDGRSLVITNRLSGSVSIFSTSDADSPLFPLTLRATLAGCPGATAPVILPDSSKAFVACSERDQVVAIGLAAAPNDGASRQGLSLSPDRVLAFLDVGRRPMNLTLKPDGGEIFVSNQSSNSVSEIATQTNEVGSTYPIGNRPAHGIVGLDNSALWISNSGADSLSLYSIDDGKLLSSLRTGSAPDALAFSVDERFLLAADRGSGDVAVIRTASKLGPALLTILPAGGSPAAIVVKAMQRK